MSSADPTRRGVIGAVALDALLVIGFAALGRRTHDEGGGVGQTLTIAAPFLIAYVVGAAAARLDRAPLSVRRGLIAAGVTAVLGLVLRNVAFDRGTAVPFVIVACVTLVTLLAGWRLVAAQVRRTRSRAPA